MICCSACSTSAGVGKYTSGRTCVTEVVTYHSAPSTAKVAAPTATRKPAVPRFRVTSVGAVGEFLELRIAIDQAHVFVGHVGGRRRRLRQRAGALHELGDLRHPLVHLRSALAAI